MLKQGSRAAQIVESVASQWGMTRATMLYRGKSNGKVQARRECIRRLRSELGMSYPEIGQIMNMHHTTVMYHLEKGPSKFDTAKVAGRLLTLDQARRIVVQQAEIIRQQAVQIAELSAQVATLGGGA